MTANETSAMSPKNIIDQKLKNGLVMGDHTVSTIAILIAVRRAMGMILSFTALIFLSISLLAVGSVFSAEILIFGSIIYLSIYCILYSKNNVKKAICPALRHSLGGERCNP